MLSEIASGLVGYFIGKSGRDKPRPWDGECYIGMDSDQSRLFHLGEQETKRAYDRRAARWDALCREQGFDSMVGKCPTARDLAAETFYTDLVQEAAERGFTVSSEDLPRDLMRVDLTHRDDSRPRYSVMDLNVRAVTIAMRYLRESTTGPGGKRT